MSTSDVISICNRSLLAVGARAQVSSINPSDGSVEANALSVLFTPTFESLARTAHWNCLGRQVTLSLLMAASGTPENPDGTSLPIPPNPWLYAYAYPSDCLDVRYIVPSYPANTGSETPQTTINNSAGAWLPSGGQITYKVQTVLDTNNQSVLTILTNQDQAQAVYTTALQNPASWDSLFQSAMVASLAVYLVPALTLSLPLMNMNIKVADEAIAVARARDGNEGVTVMDHLPDWMAARAGGGGWGAGYGFTNYGGYCYSMNWPAGSSGSYGD
jgi:hypothetical protein